jgi:hypothetical protein
MKTGRAAGFVVAGTLALSLAAGCSSSSSGGQAAAVGQVLDPTQSHYGNTDDEWGALWWKWIYELPQTDAKNCIIPFLDPTGEHCTYGQPTASSGDVFFLAGTTGGTVVRDKCVVPSGKALFFPIVTYTADNGGLPPSMVQPDSKLMATVQSQMDGVPVSGLSASFDGVAITNLERFRTQVTQFSYTLPPEPNVYTCQGQTGVTGSVSPAYAAGYYIMLSPPPPGAHTLHFAGSIPAAMPPMVDVTYHFTIK